MADVATDLDDGAGELVPERERRPNPVLRPLVPVEDVQVGPAEARRLDAHEHVVRLRHGDRHLHEDEARLARELPKRGHRHGHSVRRAASRGIGERPHRRSGLARMARSAFGRTIRAFPRIGGVMTVAKEADLAGPGIGDYAELERVLPDDYTPLLAAEGDDARRSTRRSG